MAEARARIDQKDITLAKREVETLSNYRRFSCNFSAPPYASTPAFVTFSRKLYRSVIITRRVCLPPNELKRSLKAVISNDIKASENSCFGTKGKNIFPFQSAFPYTAGVLSQNRGKFGFRFRFFTDRHVRSLRSAVRSDELIVNEP